MIGIINDIERMTWRTWVILVVLTISNDNDEQWPISNDKILMKQWK